MSVETDRSLSQAFDLIESNQLDQARAILDPVLENEKDNADAWWLYAHAVTDPMAARTALNNVLRIDSDYPEASELLQSLDAQASGMPVTQTGQLPSLLPPVPATLPGMSSSESDDDDWDALDEDAQPLPFWRQPSFLLLVGLILFLLIAALVIFRPGDESQLTATATNVANNQSIIETPSLEIITPFEITPFETPIPIEGSSPIAVIVATIPSNATAEGGEFQVIVVAMESFTLAEKPITVEETSFGNTVMANVCTQPGPELRETLDSAMDVIAQQASNVASGNDALGTRMLDCSTNTPLLVLAAPISDFSDYADGSMSKEEFQSHWIPVG